MISAIGYLLLIVDMISFIAAPSLAVTTPILLGYLGITFLCSKSNNPSCCNLFFLKFLRIYYIFKFS